MGVAGVSNATSAAKTRSRFMPPDLDGPSVYPLSARAFREAPLRTMLRIVPEYETIVIEGSLNTTLQADGR